MKNRKQITEHNYINNEDLLKKLGYKFSTSKLGSLGRALIKAGKQVKGLEWLNKQVDTMFRKVRQEKNGQKGKGDSRADARYGTGRHKKCNSEGLGISQGV